MLIGAHILISLMILNAGYFPKFYEGTMLNIKGESSMLLGVAGIIFL
jgi:hypothetical protein